MLDLFTQTLADDRRILGAGLAANDLVTLRARAHALKGAAASLGAQRLAEAAGRLQEAIVHSAAPAVIERDGAVLLDELTFFAEQVRLALKASER